MQTEFKTAFELMESGETNRERNLRELQEEKERLERNLERINFLIKHINWCSEK